MGFAHKSPDDAEWNEFVSGNARGGGMLLFGRKTYAMTCPPRPERTYMSPSGVRTTVMCSGPGFSVVSLLIVLGSTGLGGALQSRVVKTEF